MIRLLLLPIVALGCLGNAEEQIAAARPGATIKLVGEQGTLALRDRSWPRAITVDAREASFSGISLNNVRGIRFRGGTARGAAGSKGYAIHILKSADVGIDGMTITAARRGIVIDRSQHVSMTGNALTGLVTDGINIAHSQHIVVTGNSCANFTPRLSYFDAEGKLVDGDHPDCIQGWAHAPHQATTDVTVIGNRADGIMQGVFFRSVKTNTKVGMGFDRIVIRDNVLRVGMGNAIYVEGARSAVVRGNRVSSVPGVKHLKNGSPVRANIVIKGEGVDACGNSAADRPENAATRSCG